MTRILLVSHYTEVPGVLEKITAFLKRKGFVTFFILNPLYPNSSLKTIVKSPESEIQFKIFWPVQYIFESLVTLIMFKKLAKTVGNFELAICFDPLSFANIFIFKKIYGVKKVIYYNVDFSTKRFKNWALNFIYLKFNKWAYKKSTFFLYLTDSFTAIIDPYDKYKSKSFLLRHTSSEYSPVQPLKKIPFSIVFAGSLSYTTDFTQVIAGLELLKKDGVDFVLDVYGDGDQKGKIVAQFQNSIVKDSVRFMGTVENDILLNDILPQYLIGIAPYISEGENVETNHIFLCTDISTKMVDYISRGLPVVSTHLCQAFEVIEHNKFGFLTHSHKEWYVAFNNLLLDTEKYQEYSCNARNYAKNYSEEVVLVPVFNKILF